MRTPIDRRPPYWTIALSVFVTLAALIFHATPARITGGPDLMPLLPLMSIFLWASLRPRFMPPIAIFAIGVAQDVLTGGPMGVWALAYLTAMAILRDRKEDSPVREVLPLWLRFSGVLAISVVVAWVVGSLAVGALAPVRSLLIEAVSTALMFPLVAMLVLRGRAPRTGIL
ncbi:MAG: rod shape-determining protein MreD [Maricaulaceae bacterium]|nr:rod shape-determining protein MreD [Maricaulaceae bacterium]